MPYKTILVHVEPGVETRVRVAADLAARHGALLVGLGAGMWHPPVALIGPDLGAVSAEIIEAGREQVEADLRIAAKLFAKATEGSGLATEWRAVIDFPHAALCKTANAADLLVVGPLDSYTVGAEYRSANPGDVLIGAGRPVLIVPEGIGEVKADKVIVAWKNTREGRRALGDALAVLTEAQSVALVQVRERGDEIETIADARGFLARHGISVTSEIRDLKAATVVDELFQYAKEAGSDLIVSGAYGRSRLREWAFGGVTRGLLTQRAIACQLSH